MGLQPIKMCRVGLGDFRKKWDIFAFLGRMPGKCRKLFPGTAIPLDTSISLG